MEPDDIIAGLVPFIRKRTEADAVELSNLVRFSGGASRETWALDIELQRGGEVEKIPAVFRTDPSTATDPRPARRLEYTLIRAAWEHGVAVPKPLWDGDRSVFGTDFFLMRRVGGEALGPRFIRAPQYAQAREALPGQLAQSLARIHAIPLNAYPGLDLLPAPPAGTSDAAFQLDEYEAIMRTASPEPHPVFDLAFRWLRARAPQDARGVLLHGDFRLGNVMFDESGLTGILDWELAHVGDPHEDIGWVMMRSWRFGGSRPVAGVGDLQPFVDAWLEAGGGPFDPDRLRFWEAFSYLKWGIQTLSQVARYISGEHRNVEHAAIGRRPAETEIELLRMMASEG